MIKPWKILHQIYSLEEKKIIANDFDDFFHTPQELFNQCKKSLINITINELNKILENLARDGKIILFLEKTRNNIRWDNTNSKISIINKQFRWKKSELLNRQILIGPIGKFRSRNAEIIRLIYYNRNKFGLNRSTAIINYVKQLKLIPSRNISISKAQTLIFDSIDFGVRYKGIQYEVNSNIRYDLKRAIKCVFDSLDEFSTNEWGDHFHFSQFQLDSIQNFLYIKYFQDFSTTKPQNFEKEHLIITAGVGSGKTIAFLASVLIETIFKFYLFGKSGVSTLILYPRTTLVQDQYHFTKKLLPYLKQNLQKFEIKILMEAAGKIKNIAENLTSKEKISVADAIKICYLHNPPNIIFGTLETIKRRIINPDSCTSLISNLETVVFDEIHLLNGIQGTHTIYFVRRLLALKAKIKQNLKGSQQNQINFIGSSATIADPEYFASKIFGNIDKDVVMNIRPMEQNKEIDGINHHIMVKNKKGAHLLSTLTNLSSLIIHNRRNGLIPEFNEKQISNIEKTIGFADSLNVIGRWDYLMKDNEEQSLKSILTKGKLPYYGWFFEPLQKIFKFSSDAISNDPYKEFWLNICQYCKSGVEISFPRPQSINNEIIATIRKSFIRSKGKIEDILEVLEINQPNLLGTLNHCPFFKYGACWWFSQDNGELTPYENNHRYQVFPSIRTNVITSGTDSTDNEIKDIGDIDSYFNERNKDLFIWKKRHFTEFAKRNKNLNEFLDSKSNLNFLLASPKIEVGVDFKNVQEGIGFKAIRNLASYHQKMGRIGRDSNSDTMLVNILSFRPIDHHYFRNIFKLTDISYLEPIPIKEINQNVIKSEIFMSILDFITIEDSIPNDGYRLYVLTSGESYDFSSKIKAIYTYLEDRSHLVTLKSYLCQIFNDNNISEKAIMEFKKILAIFIEDISELVPFRSIAEMIDKKKGISITNQKSLNILNSFKEFRSILKNCIFYRYHFNKIGKKKLFEKLFNLKSKLEGKDYINTKLKFKEFRQFYEYIESIQLSRRKLFQLMKRKYSHNSVKFQELNRLITELTHYFGELQIKFEECYLKITQNETFSDYKCEKIFKVVIDLQDFFEEFNDLKEQKKLYKSLSYFSDVLNSFSFTKSLYPYSFPPVLFESPSSYPVEVLYPHYGSLRLNSNNLNISLVLGTLLPGTWNYRFGQLLKSPIREFIKEDNVYYTNITKIEEMGSKYRIISEIKPEDYPNEFPTQFSSINKINVLRPMKIRLIKSFSNLMVETNTGIAFDNDENIKDWSNSEKTLLNSIPTSSNSTWYDVKYNSLENFDAKLPYDNKKIYFSLPKTIRAIFSDIQFTKDFYQTNYVWSISRHYSNSNLSSFDYYFTQKASGIGNKLCFIGDNFITDGIVFTINPRNYQNFWKKLLKSNEKEFISLKSQLIIQLLFNFVTKYTSDIFQTQIILKIFLFHYIEETGQYIINIDNFNSNLDSLKKQNIEEIIQLLGKYNKINSSSKILKQTLKLKKLFLKSPLTNQKLSKNTMFIFFHTIAHLLLNASQRFIGIDSQDISYFFNIEKNEIYLFDSVEQGNGSCETLFKYLYVPVFSRQLETILNVQNSQFPSNDLITEIEEFEFTPCPYYNTSKLGFYLSPHIRNSNQIKSILPNHIKKYEADFNYNLKNGYFDLIRKIMTFYPEIIYEDLYFFQKIPEFLIQSNIIDMKIEKLETLLDVCISGCVECVIEEFNCIFGFMNATERLNKFMISMFYLDIVKNDPQHYSILDINTLYNNPFLTMKMLTKEEKQPNPVISIEIDENGHKVLKTFRMRKAPKFSQPHYIFERNILINQSPNSNKILINFNQLLKYEGDMIERKDCD